MVDFRSLNCSYFQPICRWWYNKKKLFSVQNHLNWALPCGPPGRTWRPSTWRTSPRGPPRSRKPSCSACRINCCDQILFWNLECRQLAILSWLSFRAKIQTVSYQRSTCIYRSFNDIVLFKKCVHDTKTVTCAWYVEIWKKKWNTWLQEWLRPISLSFF